MHVKVLLAPWGSHCFRNADELGMQKTSRPTSANYKNKIMELAVLSAGDDRGFV